MQSEIRLIIFFAAKDGEVLYSQQKQDQELTVAQIMNFLLPNSDWNWRKLPTKVGKCKWKDWKRSVFIPIPKNGNAKECSNYRAIALISHASKVMLKILQARLQQYVNRELPDVQVGFRKGRGTRDQIANICWIIEEAREFQKNIYFCFID